MLLEIRIFYGGGVVVAQVTAGHRHRRSNHFLQPARAITAAVVSFTLGIRGRNKGSLGAFQISKERGRFLICKDISPFPEGKLYSSS